MRRMRKTIPNDVFELMIYMIGFNPEEKFEMVMAGMLADDKEYPSYPKSKKGGSVKTSKYSKGGGVRATKYKI